jgi:hypothetical protein
MDSSGRCSTAFGPPVGLFARIVVAVRLPPSTRASSFCHWKFSESIQLAGKRSVKVIAPSLLSFGFRPLCHFAAAAPVSKRRAFRSQIGATISAPF